MSRSLGDVFQILSGNVGLGTTQPRQLLDIQGGNAIISGSVGIGTTNPLVLLHVQDNAYFSGNVGIGSTQPISAVDTGRVRINNNNTYGQINLARNDGGMNLFIEGTGTGSTASIRIRNTGGNSSTAYEMYDSHRWYINSLTTERMRLDSSGNLGIGTTAPTHKLHIYSASRTDNDYETAGILLDNVTQGEAAIAFRNSNVGVAGNVWIMGLNSNSTRFDIGYGAQSSQMADASVDMCINTDGNVGIGTTNPLQKLHVEGNSYLNGTITATGLAGGVITNSTSTTNSSIAASATAVKSAYDLANAALPITGGTVTGNVTILANLTASNLTVIGDTTILNTISSNTEQMIITNAGTGPALKVTQTGENSVAEFYDNESGIALFVGNNGNIGIGKTNPLYKLQVEGASYFNGTITTNNSNINVGSGTVTATTFSGTATRVSQEHVPGTYLTGTNYNGAGTVTWAVDATTTATANKVVVRDASGNFSAGTITASLAGTATQVSQNLIRGTYLTGANYNGSVATTWAVDADTVATANKVVVRDASANIFASGVGIGTISTTNANVSLSGDIYYNVSPLPVLTQSTTVDGYPIILHAQSTTGAGSLASNAIAFASMTSALSAQTPGAVIQFRRTGASGFGALELCTKSAESLLSPVLPRIVMEGGNVGIGTTIVSAGKLVVAGNIVPSACNIYSLGTTDLRWKDIYLAGKTIDLDGAQITKDDVTGGILLRNVNGGSGDIKAANLFTSGNVGIGTTVASYPLDVNGDINFTGILRQGGSAYVSSQWTSNNATNSLYYNGNVGIGTTDTSSRLVIGNNATNDEIVKIQSQNYAGLEINGDTANAAGESGGSYIRLQVDGTNTPGTLALNQNAGGNGTRGGTMIGSATNSLLLYTTSAIPLQFGTANIIRMTLDDTGNFGVGTTNPAYKLHVVGTTQLNGAITTNNNNINAGTGTITADTFAGTATRVSNNLFPGAYMVNTFSYNGEATTTFDVDATTTATANKVVARNASAYMYASGVGIGTTTARQLLDVQGGDAIISGNVGIGTTIPLKKLDVQGDINFTGSLYQNNALYVSSQWTSNNATNSLYYNGNVGIGTTNPLQKLHVEGTSYLNGAITTNNNNINAGTGTITADTFAGTATRVSNNLFPGAYMVNTFSYNGEATTTFDVDATSTATASKVVARDASAYMYASGVGIGTATARKLLDIQGGDAIVSGNVGIGTTIPLQKLHIESPGTNTNVVIRGSVLSTTTHAELQMVRGGSYRGAGMRITTTDNTENQWWIGARYTGTAVQIGYNVSQPELPASAMVTVKNSGLVGIGTAEPTHKLHIYSASRTDNDYESAGILLDNATQGETAIAFRNSNVGVAGNVWVMGLNSNSTRFDIGYGAQTSQLADASVDMCIDVGGNVGIGTTNPLQKLHVEGTEYISTALGIGLTQPAYALDVAGYVRSSLGFRVGANEVIDSDGNFILRSIQVLNGTGDTSLFVSETGYVGISTDNPVVPLDIRSTTVNISGSVGIGTTAPRKLLDIQGGDAIVSGNVGIGTTAPSHKLHIYSASRTDNDYESTGILLDNATQGEAAIAFRNSNVGVAGNVWVMGLNSNSTRFDIGYGAQTSQLADALVDMCIDVGGNIGIGTTIPLAKLHIRETNGSYPSVIGIDGTGGRIIATHYMSSDSYNGALWAVAVRPTDNNNLYFAPNIAGSIDTLTGASYANTAKVTFKQDGNVGIGTTAPLQKLDVYGNATIGRGQSGSSSSTSGGPFFKQNSWDTAGTTHTLTYPAFCIGDNSSGTLFIQVSNKSNKIGTAHYSFIKCLGFGVDIFESSYHRNTNLATFNVTTNGADIVVTTDSDCSISWTSIGSY